MKYLVNKLFLIYFKFLNRFGKFFSLKRKLLSCEIILMNNFKKHAVFKFIQVGANDGISFDFLYDFVKNRNSFGIVVEPVKAYYDELVINYNNFPEIIKINCAVHPNEKEVVIYKVSSDAKGKYPDWAKGIASLDKDHHKKTNINSKDIVMELVKAENLMKIISDNHFFKIDYLQIDTEGYDYEVIKMINFNKIKPFIIRYESVNLSNKDNYELSILLKSYGYFLFNEFGDRVGINLNKIKLY